MCFEDYAMVENIRYLLPGHKFDQTFLAESTIMFLGSAVMLILR